MSVLIERFVSQRSFTNYETMYVKVSEMYRNEIRTWSTKAVPVIDGVATMNEKFEFFFAKVESIRFDIMLVSELYGTSMAASAEVQDIQFTGTTVTLSTKEIDPTFINSSLSITFSPNEILLQEVELIDDIMKAPFALHVHSEKPTKLALIYANRNFASYCEDRFNTLKFIEFSENMILIDTNTMGTSWTSFFLFVETESPTLSVSISNRNAAQIFHHTGKSMIPIKISRRGANLEIKSISVEIDTGRDELRDNLKAVLRQVGVRNATVSAFLPTDKPINIPVDKIKVILNYEFHRAEALMDISFTSVSKSGSLNTCFFNNRGIAKDSIIMNDPSNKLNDVDSCAVIDFKALPASVTSIIIALTSFHRVPVRDFGLVTLTFTDINDNLLFSVPITGGTEPGFFVGTIENRQFHFHGIEINAKMPVTAAKMAQKILDPVEENDSDEDE